MMACHLPAVVVVVAGAVVVVVAGIIMRALSIAPDIRQTRRPKWYKARRQR